MRQADLGRKPGGPLYHRIRQDILAQIRRGDFEPGDQLPSENQLCTQYGVSVTTARRALLELVKEGVVQRKAGVGTMVAPQVRQARLSFISIDYVNDAWRHISSAMGEVTAGIGEYAWQHDAALNIIGIGEDEAATYLRGLTEERSVDGVLLRTANDIHEEYLEILEQAGLPYVVIKRHIPGREMNCVISDDILGARIATSHLLSLGHNRIGFVCAKPHITLGRERLTGYRTALMAEGIGFDSALVRQEPHFTMEMGYRAVKSLLQAPAPPSAIFVASDTMALGGYQAAWDLGLRIPDDVAFVGYDDLASAAVLQPPLTTIRTSYYDFGRLATQLLLDIIDGRELAPQRRVIQPTLVVRESAKRSESVARTPAVQKEMRSAAPVSGSVPIQKRLSGRVVVSLGPNDEVMQAIIGAYEAEGAHVMPDTSFPQKGDYGTRSSEKNDVPGLARAFERHGRADLLLCTFNLEPNLDMSWSQAVGYGRTAATRMSERGLGRLVYVAALETDDTFVGKAKYSAARAGLAQVVKTLAAEWTPKGIGINALIVCKPLRVEDIIGPAVFLASDEAASISGEVLAVGEPKL